MSDGVVFPNHYPPDCPPGDAEEATGVVYRVTRSDPPTPDDFLSFNELGVRLRKDTPFARCQSRGLSVFRSLADARHLLLAIPATGDYIAEGTLTPERGRTKLTPVHVRPTHTTWWCAEGINLAEGFAVIEGRSDVGSEGN